MSYPELTLAGERKLPRIVTGVFRVGLHRYTLLAGLLLAFVGLVTLLAPTDPDVWWHLRNGQLILDSGVPHTDVLSFTAYGRMWIVHEWLAEVVMYVVKSALGYGVLSLLFGVFQAAGGLVVYLLVRRAGAGRLTALLLLMVYLVFASPSWGVRVQVVDPMFLGVFYLILLSYRANPARQRLLWIPPLLIVLWTNLHASYSAGLALIAVFAVGEFANNWLYRPARPTPVRPLLISLVACLAVTLINPYFIELWTYPLTYVLNGMSNPLLKYIQEWQSPNFHEPQSLLFAATFILVAITGIARPTPESERYCWRLGLTRRVDITTTILFAAFTVIALQAMRFIPVYGVIVLPFWPGRSQTSGPPSQTRMRLHPLPSRAE